MAPSSEPTNTRPQNATGAAVTLLPAGARHSSAPLKGERLYNAPSSQPMNTALPPGASSRAMAAAAPGTACALSVTNTRS